MKNLTITVDDNVLEWARIEAARRGSSVSRMVGDFLGEMQRREDAYERAYLAWRTDERTWRSTGDDAQVTAMSPEAPRSVSLARSNAATVPNQPSPTLATDALVFVDTSVLVAAVAQVLPSSLPSDVVQLRDALHTRIDPARRAELERVVEALQARDGRLDLKPWIRAIELASCRAGLLVCGDITAAARMLAVDGRVVGGLSAADRIRDLIPFSVSARCAKVRRAIGIGATAAAPS